MESERAARGVLHDPSGRSALVALEWGSASRTLRVHGGGIDLSVPGDRIRISGGGWTGDAVHLAFDREGRVVSVTVDDPGALATLEAVLPGNLAQAVSAQRERSRRGASGRRILFGVLALAVLAPFVLLGLLILHPDPFLAAAVGRLPARVDVLIGDAVEAHVTQTADVVADGPLPAVVESIGRRLLAAADEHPFAFRFHVVRDDTVNAFAAPGGVVVVHTGLVRAAADPAELAGVLAHEIGHALERHSLRQIAYQAGLGATFLVLFGSVDAAGATLADATRGLATLGFSRDQERTADRVGFELLQASGIPGEGMARFFERLAEDEGNVPGFLATHPGSAERARQIRDWIAAEPLRAERPLEVDWDAVRGALER